MSLFKRKPKESLSAIGRIIDQPMKDFKKTLEKEKTNICTMNNLIHYLNGAYADLRQRKEIEKAVKGIYAELIKIEEKVTYLTEKVKELVVVEDEIDSPK